MPWKLPVHHLLWTLELYPSSGHLPDEFNKTWQKKKRQQKNCSKWWKNMNQTDQTIQKCIKMYQNLRFWDTKINMVETFRTLGFMDSARAKSTRQHFQVWECKKTWQAVKKKGDLWLSVSSRLMNNGKWQMMTKMNFWMMNDEEWVRNDIRWLMTDDNIEWWMMTDDGCMMTADR